MSEGTHHSLSQMHSEAIKILQLTLIHRLWGETGALTIIGCYLYQHLSTQENLTRKYSSCTILYSATDQKQIVSLNR